MKPEVIVLDRGIFLRERSSYRGPKQSPTNSHNDRKIESAKLFSLIIAIDILMHFRCNLFMKKYFI